MFWHRSLLALVLGLTLLGTRPLEARESVVFQHHAVDPLQTNRIIVKWRTNGVAAVQMERVEARASRLSSATGIGLAPSRNLFGRTDVMLLDHIAGHDEMLRILGRLNADPAVEYAEVDAWRELATNFGLVEVDGDHWFLNRNHELLRSTLAALAVC